MINTEQESIGPGRPRSPEKRDAILDAARELFLDLGFSETSMEQIALHAGVGKPTIYNHFGSKQELFQAIVQARSQELFSQLKMLTEPSGDPASDLYSFALFFQEIVLTSEARCYDRLVIAEANRSPEFAQTLYQAGPKQLLTILANYLQAQHEAGRLHIPNLAYAAEHLLGLILSVEFVRSLMMSQEKRSAAEMQHRAHSAISVFLSAYGPRENH